MSTHWSVGLIMIFYILRYLYIYKTTFTAFEIKCLTIQPIIQFVIDTIDKIWLSIDT